MTTPAALLAPLRKAPSGKPRIHLLDELRGFAVFCMVFYHGFYTLSTISGLNWCTALLRFFQPAEPYFAGLFIFLSGIAANLTRSNLRRGAKLAAIALAVTLLSLLVAPATPIWFGVLHLLAVSMLLAGVLLPRLERVPLWPGVALCGALTALTAGVSQGYLGIFSIELLPLPHFLYETDWFCWLGTYSAAFFSADYFPLLPWLFVFFGGVFFGRLARDGRFPPWTYRRHVPFFAFLGRHALLFYLVHQPVFYGVAWLVNQFL